VELELHLLLCGKSNVPPNLWRHWTIAEPSTGTLFESQMMELTADRWQNIPKSEAKVESMFQEEVHFILEQNTTAHINENGVKIYTPSVVSPRTR
jgi:hypothetical protein